MENGENVLAILCSSVGSYLVINGDVFLYRALELHMLAPEAWFADGVAYPHPAWFSTDLLPKLARWAAENKSSEFSSTLSLLPVEKYSIMYQQLKEKYKAMVKVGRCASGPNCSSDFSAPSFSYMDISVGLAGGHGSREVRV